MRARFWGCRGSLPATVDHQAVAGKVSRALEAAVEAGLSDPSEIPALLDSLPFAVRATYGTNTSCMQVETQSEELVVCDAGTGLRDFGAHLAATRGPSPHVVHLFVSHPHWDHIQGFPFFIPAYVPGNRIVIYGGHSELERAFRRQQDAISFPVPFDAFGALIDFVPLDDGQSVEAAGMTVTAALQDHPGGSFGYRFEAGGKRLVYSTDSEHRFDAAEPNYHYLDFVRRADLLVFDAQYTFRDAVTAKEDWGHSSNLVGVELAKTARVKRLALFHHEPTLSDDALEKFHADTVRYAALFEQEVPLEVDMAYDGLVIEV